MACSANFEFSVWPEIARRSNTISQASFELDRLWFPILGSEKKRVFDVHGTSHNIVPSSVSGKQHLSPLRRSSRIQAQTTCVSGVNHI
jgi:hypothetical protein